MARSTTGSLYAIVALGLAALGCEAGGVGDPCTPEDEYDQTFSGYSVKEVNTESRSFQCETRLCLVNHFQGRVSCPYGQTQAEADIGKPPPEGNDAPTFCTIPGTDGTDPFDRVTVAVDGQLLSRRAEKTVYCSCRCANADGNKDDGARYCDCPSGFDCEKLITPVGLGKQQLTGFYCIQQGTKYDEFRVGNAKCEPNLGNCEE
jgi:hypothetical protein